ncbi:MAG: hypothetical protein K8S18_16780, partial [Desulfobacula sp.]|nr:hypothetical protein [Desulfobacula sp.]
MAGLLLSGTFAGDLSVINYQSNAELKQLNANPALNIHFVCNDFIIVSSEQIIQGKSKLIEKDAFQKSHTYYVASFFQGKEPSYYASLRNETT